MACVCARPVAQPGAPAPWAPSSDRDHTAFQMGRRYIEVKPREFRRLEGVVRNELASAGGAALVNRLRDDGMTWSAVGLDFTQLQWARHRAAPSAVLADAEVGAMLNATCFLVHPHLARTLWTADQPSRRPACALCGASALESGLHRDGFVTVDDWGLDVAALRTQALAALAATREKSRRAAETSGRDLWTTKTFHSVVDASLPALAPLLRNESVAASLRGYLGGTVRYDGAVVLQLSHGINHTNYLSSLWHHDRCGKRLKLFIFVHDVGARGRPTVVAPGTHNTLYFSHELRHSRFTEAYVASREGARPAVPMLGRAGGGFVFDTNALHKGEVRGDFERTTVILEFHAHNKIRPLDGAGVPCPSAERGKRENANGVAGWPLYPPEKRRGRKK